MIIRRPKLLIVGSQALCIGLEKVGQKFYRTPTDLDLFARENEVDSTAHVMGLRYISGTSQKRLYKAPDGNNVEIEIAGSDDSTDLYMKWGESFSRLDQVESYGGLM